MGSFSEAKPQFSDLVDSKTSGQLLLDLWYIQWAKQAESWCCQRMQGQCKVEEVGHFANAAQG